MHYSRTTTSVACLALLLGGAPLAGFTAVAKGATDATIAATGAVSGASTPALMLATNWHAGRSPAGYLVSEKLDGVRAAWDGQQLRFRSGRPIAAPAWFVAALPKVALDGELWLGRGRFDELSGIVRHAVPVDADWREVRYMVFDLPGTSDTFAERSRSVPEWLAASQVPWLQAVAQRQVADAPELAALLKQTVLDGGEGLVLHRANALWSPGRSDALCKLKLVPDEEARVVGYLDGKGRNAGRLGALLLELPSGLRFALGSGFSDAQRAAPPCLRNRR